MLEVKFKSLHKTFELPKMMTKGAAAFDFAYCGDDPILILPSTVYKIPLGCAVEIPVGYEMQLRPRSGLAVKQGITLVNAPGTIDSDFRGELKAIVIKLTDGEFYLHPGDRVCQMLICKLESVKLKLTEDLAETDRGEGGFGSTDRS